MEGTKPHAALLASPGMGHLIPVLELGKRLITHHGFQVTVFVVATEVSPAPIPAAPTSHHSSSP
ncbi:UDP-glycosyltransferase 72E1 [Vitis vinifera]|uniref:UDP-glycosyltransferase 72E1 n=1 Tax=Vitis vinifera TaxID=29760 RepID=A0A438GP12_VITVI|nr:UDP-glycosyltransferase 72E1 [Vitis vinifera]